MVTQCFMYYSRYPTDKYWMKLMVGALFAADTLNCIFDMWWIYDILINHFMDLNALSTGNWIFATDPAMVGIIATMVQLFFAWRVKVLTGNMWMVTLITLTAFGSIFGGIAICDSAITLSLSWHLRRHKTGFTGTDDILNKIIRLTVQNGLITAVWAIVDLIAYLATPTGLHLAFNFPLAKLYTNSLMSSLNSRTGWKYQTSGESTGHKISRDPQARRLDVVNLSTATRPEVFVHVESHELADVGDKRDIEWSSDAASASEASKRQEFGSPV
ncbi:hypothetical protein EW026_g6312 [Hermanssonia centrifuga]|uniref:DUF6534 domain-containing protein n=1 Tax=Hermanssonia centrifuga TaxID=98765 RepID=A0A4S4KCD7_9APHY|nr:hypothetical protein EW026_g6312 [Hermanssonia centrifuga]